LTRTVTKRAGRRAEHPSAATRPGPTITLRRAPAAVETLLSAMALRDEYASSCAAVPRAASADAASAASRMGHLIVLLQVAE